MRLIDEVRRESRTEEWVRGLDVSEIVSSIHNLEDIIQEKDADIEALQRNFVSRDYHREVVDAQAERIAELEAENAESDSGVAAIEYAAAQAWFEAWRTLSATKRAEMTLR